MLSKLKMYAKKPGVCFAAGVAVGLGLATTIMGAKAASKIAALRAKAGI